VIDSGLVEPDWRRAVRVREDAPLAAELEERRAREAPRPSVGVTDLIALRRAFWRLTVPPVAVPPERQARLDSGRFLHRQVERVIAPDCALEVRLRREGLVGRIDALTDRPVEVKSATVAVEEDALVTDRPEQVEQLGMYCALLERPVGRLVTLVARGDTVEEVRTYDITYRELPAMLAEMQARAESLRSCLRAGRPDGLARCRWYGRGCEYRSLPTCDCTGTEPDPSSAILERVERVEPRPQFDAELLPRLAEALRTTRPPSILRFRDMIYPRRAYFERTRPSSAAPKVPSLPRDRGRDAYRELIEAVESGPVGEMTRIPSLSDEPEEEVGGFRGAPFLLRTSRARTPLTAGSIVAQAPQYALELGFRCTATGRSSGRVFVSLETVESARARFKVFEFEFSPMSSFARLWRHRARDFETAVERRAPLDLPACPTWMFADCPYQAECACGPDPGRSHR
jgi:hypothetical protein